MTHDLTSRPTKAEAITATSGDPHAMTSHESSNPTTYQFYQPRALLDKDDAQLTVHLSPVVVDPVKISQLFFPLDLPITKEISGYVELRFAIYHEGIQVMGTSILAVPCLDHGPSAKVYERHATPTDQISIWVGEGVPDDPLMALQFPEVGAFKWLCHSLPHLFLSARPPIRADELQLITNTILSNFPNEDSPIIRKPKTRRRRR